MGDDDPDLSPLHLPGSLNLEDLLVALRAKEDLEYKLNAVRVNPPTGENYFEFASTIDDEPLPEGEAGDPERFLKMRAFACAPTDTAACAGCREDFHNFGGGEIALDDVIRLGSVDTYVIFYRGADAEFPQPHAASPPAPPLPFIPEDARRAFDPQEILADLPLHEASTLRMSLRGLKDSVISYFQDDKGAVDAFVMVTDADIDTDGPGGSLHNDPWYGSETSLQYPDGRGSCNSRAFPGVVRSVRLRSQFQLKLGDLAYIYYQGKAVACQIYDQGEDSKIGEVSLYAAYKVGVIPPTMSEYEAARHGNNVSDLITLCFPGSCPEHRALPEVEIQTRAATCLRALTDRLAGKKTTPPPPVTADNVTPGIGAGKALEIFPRGAWKALPAKVSSFATHAAQGIVIHNTQDANRAPQADPEAEKRVAFALSLRIQHSHMVDRGWLDIGQHFTISRGGVIMEARTGSLANAVKGLVVSGAHAGVGEYNRSWWGIEIEGDFRHDARAITPQQAEALQTLCRWLGGSVPHFDPARHVRGHREVKPGGTDCPGQLLNPAAEPDFLTQLRQELRSGGAGTLA